MTNEQYYCGTGRRKNAVARVRLYAGPGPHTINDKPLEEMFPRPQHRYQILLPLVVTESQEKFHAQVKVAGGGVSGWAGAIAHGIARALAAADESVPKPLPHLPLPPPPAWGATRRPGGPRRGGGPRQHRRWSQLGTRYVLAQGMQAAGQPA